MTLPAVKVTGLSKRYRIGARQAGQKTFREALVDGITSPFRNLAHLRSLTKFHAEDEENIIWALKDVNFEVRQGEALGIIGANGAGKSTLLKILSRITEPTTGQVEIRGRVSSLLEVGTGFHQELTGRENVYLNGTILGMRKKEIDRKFDEIVDFSGVEKFLDTPVKRYSSGMQVRLAFAVAAHLEPEILIVDEVLAVGDAAFQKKCLGKMGEVAGEGRTVLFVSHNMAAVTRLCHTAIFLEGGRLLQQGPAEQMVSAYLSEGLVSSSSREWDNPAAAPGNNVARLRAVRIISGTGEVCSRLDITQPIGIAMEFEVLEPSHVLAANYHFYNEEGICVFIAGDSDPAWQGRERPVGRYTSTAWIPGNFLAEGSFAVDVAVSTMASSVAHFYERAVVGFEVIDPMDGSSARGDYMGVLPGVVRPLLKWENEYIPTSEEA